jgi:hypothetical protein
VTTEDEIREAERECREAVAHADAKRAARDKIIRQAIAERWTHERIAQATIVHGKGLRNSGKPLSRGRINQIAQAAPKTTSKGASS